MKGIRYAEGLKVLPILAPSDISGSAATSSQPIWLREVQWVSFLVYFGAMTSDSTDTITVTVESSTGQSTASTDEAIAFNYRLASAVATDSMGAITAATSDGLAITADAYDNKALIIDVDPAYVAGKDTDAVYLRLVFTRSSTDLASFFVGATAILEPRYPGNSMNSAT